MDQQFIKKYKLLLQKREREYCHRHYGDKELLRDIDILIKEFSN